jgi:O-antigen/teichoic acid export membrane protein
MKDRQKDEAIHPDPLLHHEGASVTTPRDILRSGSLMFLSQIINMLIGLATTVLIARSLGEDNFGIFSSLIATVALVSIIPDFGFGPILVRELVQKPEKIGAIVGTGLVLRFVMFVGTLVLLNVILLLLHVDDNRSLLINIMLLNVLFSAKLPVLRNVLESVFRSRLTMGIPVVFAILDSAILFIFVLMLLRPDTSLLTFVILYTVSNIPGFLLMLVATRRATNVPFSFDRNLARSLVVFAFPVFLYAVFIAVYSNADVLLLQYTLGNYQTGIYGAAARLAGPLSFVSNAVTVALYPSLSKYAHGAGENTGNVVRLGFKILAVIGVSVAVFGFFSARPIATFLYGTKFQESWLPLSILLFAQVFAFLSFFFTNVNTAINRQVWNTLFAVTLCTANIGLNLLLIPHWSASGAATAKLLTEFVGCVLLWMILRRFVTFDSAEMLSKILGLTILLSSAMFLLKGLNIVLFLVLSFAVLLLLLVVLRVFDESEMSKLKLALQKAPA